MTYGEIDGLYGKNEETECTIFYCCETAQYCVQGSTMVNTVDRNTIFGTIADCKEHGEPWNVEYSDDCDCFTWNQSIDTLEQFIEAIES